MANSLNNLMEKAFEDYFPKSKETKSKKNDNKNSHTGEPLLNALVQSYRDITGKKDAVEVNELFKWYWDTYDTGEAQKGNHRLVNLDIAEDGYTFDWPYKQDSSKYLENWKDTHPPATFIIHMAVAFKLKPTQLDELLQEYGYLPLHVRNLHHLTIYAVLNKYSPDDGRYDQFATIKEWYFEAIKIMKFDDSEIKTGAMPESVNIFTAYERSDLTRMLSSNFKDTLNRQGIMEKDQFIAFVNDNRRQFRQRHSAILNEHRRLASVLGKLNERRPKGYETAEKGHWEEACTWANSDCKSSRERQENDAKKCCEKCNRECGNDFGKRKCGNLGEIEEELCENCKSPTCLTEKCSEYIKYIQNICEGCNKNDCQKRNSTINRARKAYEKERTYNFECFVENFCNKEDQKHFKDNLMTHIHSNKSHHPTRECMILLWLFAEIYRNHESMSYPTKYYEDVMAHFTTGYQSNENDENPKNEMNEKIKQIENCFTGKGFDIALYLFGETAHPMKQGHLWDGAKVRDVINDNLREYGWDMLNIKRSFDKMVFCFLQFTLDQTQDNQIKVCFRSAEESDHNNNYICTVDLEQKVPAPLWLLIEFARFGKDNHLKDIKLPERKKYISSKGKKIYPFLCNLYEQ